jgi:biopolymer transport protein ExbD
MADEVKFKTSVKNEPNVVPMIDIMLVLLIIFMIVTPIISSGMQATMPWAKEIESRPEEEGDVILGIDMRGQYYLDPGTKQIGVVCRAGDASCNQETRLEELLRSIYDVRTKDKIIYLRAHSDLEYGSIQDAVEVCRSSGVRVMAVIAEERRVLPGQARAATREGGD